MALDADSMRWLESRFKSGVRFEEPMARHTSLRIGGPAEVFAAPETVDDLQALINWSGEKRLSYLIIGRGTNLLVKDAGIRGVVVVLTKCLNTIEETGSHTDAVLVTAMAGANLTALCAYALKRGLKGMNFSLGIPGTVGGGIKMNAGTSHGSMENVLKSIDVLLPSGKTRRIEGKALDFAYRELSWNPELTEGHEDEAIILNGRFSFYPSDPDKLKKTAREIIMARRRKQPIGFPSAGCVFKNPGSGPTAGQLIEMAGLKGKSIGGAQISPKHANFFINRRNASAADFLSLIDLTEDTILKKFNIHLEREVKVVGA
jgi:UDP-N-acetylmuramate dehydrogenase